MIRKRTRTVHVGSSTARMGMVKRTLIWMLALAITAAIGLNFMREEYDIDFAPQRLLEQDPRLGIFETRIADVASEFMRRSPELRKSFEEFSACTRSEASLTGSCDSKPILLKRDQAIKAVWPEMIDRLARPGDWGERSASRDARKEYFAEKDLHSPQILRNRCLPKITFTMSIRDDILSRSIDMGA